MAISWVLVTTTTKTRQGGRWQSSREAWRASGLLHRGPTMLCLSIEVWEPGGQAGGIVGGPCSDPPGVMPGWMEVLRHRTHLGTRGGVWRGGLLFSVHCPSGALV